MGFRENLRDELFFQGLKLTDLAERTKIPYRTLMTYVRSDYHLPNIENGVLIAKALNVSCEFLVKGTDDKIEYPLKDIYPLIMEIKKLTPKQLAITQELIHIIYSGPEPSAIWCFGPLFLFLSEIFSQNTIQ